MRAVVATGVSQLDPRALGTPLAQAPLRLRAARLGRMDPLCALALIAADHALADAGLDLGALGQVGGERIAVVVGTRFGCHGTNEDYFRQLLAEGPRAASPRLFAYTLPSSPLGEIAIHFGARGPGQTVASGRHAGLEAVARAAALCAEGRADLALAVAVEIGGGTLVEEACRDGAAAIVVEEAQRARAAGRAALARLAGAGNAFVAGSATEAVGLARARAFAEAGLPPRSPRDLSPLPVAPGAGAVDAVAALCGWLRAAPGEGRACLVEVGDERGGACALLAVGAAPAAVPEAT